MAKGKGEYICANCGYRSPKWLGRCPSCQQWETFEVVSHQTSKRAAEVKVSPVSLKNAAAGAVERWALGWPFTDRMLGGGIVPGSLILLGGAPGVGKSTLLLQWASVLAEKELKVFYISAEETVDQVQVRSSRLNALSEKILVVSERSMEVLEEAILSVKPQLFVLDSIQMVYVEDAGGGPGSVSQVCQCTSRLMDISKREGITGIVVGHITKEGSLAGPKSMEHMVDVVLRMEGEGGGATRILRVSKNRYGPTLEMAVLVMTKRGLKEIDNPSQLFLKDRTPNTPGSVVTASLEGNSPLLLEVQALVSNESSGIPKRVIMGADANRVALVAAVLEKVAGFHLSHCDIYLNVPGGIRLSEPAADLAIAMAIISSWLKTPFLNHGVIFGEVGLGGEVRMVPGTIQRIQEAVRMGFKEVVLPHKSLDQLEWKGSKRVKLKGVKRIEDAIELCHNDPRQF